MYLCDLDRSKLLFIAFNALFFRYFFADTSYLIVLMRPIIILRVTCIADGITDISSITAVQA